MPAKVDLAVQLPGLLARYEAGESFQTIASSLGCGKNTARKYLLQAGVSPDRARSIGTRMRGRPGHRLGAAHSAESRAKMSAAQRGRPATSRGPHSEETRRRISAATLGKNVKHTAERRREIESIRQACKRFVRRVLNASGKRKTTPTQLLLGYSTAQIAAHLGPRPEGAHIDHRVPIVEFIRRGITDTAVINALPNLQWLDGRQNQRKGATVPPDADVIIAACVQAADKPRGEVLTAHFGGGPATYTRGLA